jgi:predicted metalloprotease with PDZ domain
VKRIHPRALGPFDYTRENYTRALWVMEGVTSYYDRYTLRRAGLQPVKRYMEKLAEEWGKLLAIPGRKKQSIEESSFDAWVKLYRPDENSVNSTVSYYLKGGLVALCLDLEIRRRTAGTRSLDDVMRSLWKKYGERGEGFADDVQREMETAVELELGAFFDRSVRGREDPDLAAALAGVGLQLKLSWEKFPPEGAPDGIIPGWLGVNTRSDGGHAVVSATLAGGPAEQAGLYAGDEIVALDGYRVEERGLTDRVSARRAGDRVRLTIFRRDELRDVEVTLGTRPHDKLEIVPADPDKVGDAERNLYKQWLGEEYPKKLGS